MQDDDIIRDTIPLSEVTNVDADKTVDFQQTFHSFARKRLSNVNATSNSFQGEETDIFGSSNSLIISTKSDGFNSGRKYHFQAASDCDRDTLTSQLKRLARDAKKRVKGRKQFARSQEKVKKLIGSVPCQTALILVIFAVIYQVAHRDI